MNKYKILLHIFFFFISSIGYSQLQIENKIELVSIDFVGNNYFPSSELENIITAKSSPNWFSKIWNSITGSGNSTNYFDSLSIQSEINLLKNYYFSNGFFRTKIQATFNLEKPGLNKASLVFNIVENQPTKFNNILLTGIENIPPAFTSRINSMIKIDSTVQYSDQKVEETTYMVLGYLQDNGYMFAQTDQPIVEIDTVYENSVNVQLNFNLGKRYKIRNVTVEKNGPGKDLVSNSLIEEVVNIIPEKYYSYHELKMAQIRLYRTNLFSSAIITGDRSDTLGNYVPIRIITEVGLLNELSPEIIAINDMTESNSFKLGLGLSWTNKNFLGDARKLTIGSSVAAENIGEFIKNANFSNDNIYGFADVRASIEQPFLFGKPINTKFETFYTLEKKRNEWNASIYGTKLNFNFELPKYNYLTALSTYFTWQSAQYVFSEAYLHARLDSSLSTLTTNSKNIVLGVQLFANKTNDQTFPTSGYSISILAEDGNSFPYLISKILDYNFNNSAYYKIVLTSTYYFSFLSDLFDSFGAKFKIGNIHTYYGNALNIPFNQRLTAGGSNSIRGWRANDLPLIKSIKLTDNPTQAEIENAARKITPGGFFLLEGSIEARQHITEKIVGALFMDYGNVWNSYSEIKINKIAIASGFGLRYYSEYAAIRFDFGFKVYDPSNSNSFYQRKLFDIMSFQLGIGEAF